MNLADMTLLLGRFMNSQDTTGSMSEVLLTVYIKATDSTLNMRK